MVLIKSCPALLAQVKTFKEINIDFLSVEAHVFHLDERPSCYGELYGDARPAPSIVPFAERVAGKLLTICSALHEYPVIRCRPNSPMEVCSESVRVEFVLHVGPHCLSVYPPRPLKRLPFWCRRLVGFSSESWTAWYRPRLRGGTTDRLGIQSAHKEFFYYSIVRRTPFPHLSIAAPTRH